MVEQALDKLQKRSKYIPPQMQSEFIAMLIHTFDSTLDGFEECKGPATTAAIKHSIDINQILVPFLVVWAEFEFVRSSETRYKNLVIEIFKQLVYLDNADQHVSSDILMANNSNLLASLTTSMPQAIPGALPGSMPQTIPGAMPQAIPGALPGTIQPNMPGNLNVNMAGQMPQSIPGAVAPNVAGGNVVGGIAAGVSGGNVAGVPPVSNLPSNGSASTSIGNLNEDDNYLMDFIKPLDFLPLELYSQLYDLCSNYPTQSNKILNAVNEYVSGAPASQEFFLRSLLALCVHDLEIVHLHAIEIIRTYYKHGNEIEEINRFAVENLEKSVTLENPMPHLELFFAILDLDFSLFLNLMDVYAKSPKQGLLREKLKQKIPTMHIGIDVIAQALEVAPENKHKTNLLHFYLSELAKKFSVPPDLVELLKKQFLRIHDSRYLIPIIPNLTEEEFKKYLPNILTLESHALKRAITSLLTSSIQPIKPVIFLIELHKPEIAGKYLDKAIEAMELCFEQKDIFTYQLSISAVDAVIRNKYYHLIMDTLLQMVKTYPSSHKYILYHVVQPLIFNNITQMEEPWKKLKRLLYETKPTSCKLALSLPADKVKDLIEEYPDYQSLLVGTAKDKSKTRTVISQDVLDVLNSTNTAPKEEEKAATTEN
ncbi:hypothetical protein TRFO_18184 [Tritrichomonas foetus]|uniref:Symplekin C-terminal domain-containing protein n=1 Tax=Tritrichomonas foetus TaxID=1144522 RepID=A0A1J4KML9_9EUKA|nr:hypothetical protein TRFO_18184 [Tritrichomonas foetus]|eukprot:OHT12176.1 hypothetical protein TRFO_18184 [Tritrichomonas foetus]